MDYLAYIILGLCPLAILVVIALIIWAIISIISDKRHLKNEIQNLRNQIGVSIYDDFIEGVGFVVHRGSRLSGGSFNPMNGSVQSVSVGAIGHEELRNFKLKYSQITAVDILLELENEKVLIINTASDSYRCYVDDCEKYRDDIFKRIGT